MLSHPSIKLLSSLSSKKAIIAQVIDFILHVVYNKPKGEKSPGKRSYAMLFVTKGKKKKLIETKILPPNEQSLHMKIVRANFLSCGGANCMNQHFEILNLVDHGWEVSDRRLETSWFEESVFSLFKTLTRNGIIWTHYQMILKTLTTLPVKRRMKMKVFPYLT